MWCRQPRIIHKPPEATTTAINRRTVSLFTCVSSDAVCCRVDRDAGPLPSLLNSRQGRPIGGSVSTPMAQQTNTYQNRVELLQGTLDMLILRTLQWGPQHGYGIVQAIRTLSSEALQVETGSLYPALHRLERQGWVQSEWKQTPSKQRAKFYRITAQGKKQFASDLDRWKRLVEAIEAIIQGEPRSTEE